MNALRKSVILPGLLSFFAVSALAQPALLPNDVPWFERPIGEGVLWRSYQFDNLEGRRQNINVLEIDLNVATVKPILDFRPGPNDLIRTSIIGQQLNASPRGGGRVVGGINGTFYNLNPVSGPPGGGTTYLRVDGVTIHPFDSTDARLHGGGIAFNDRTDVTLRPRPSGGWATIANDFQNIMVNGYWLVEGGTIVAPTDTTNAFRNLNPRTAIGITADNRLLYVTIDGRQASTVAAGLTIIDTARLMRDLGAVDATNLDGGGSTTMWVRDEPLRNGVVNAFSDANERGVANALYVLANPATPRAFDARLNSVIFNSLQAGGDTFTVTLTYTNIGSSTWTPSTVTVVPSRPFNRSSVFIPAGQENSFATLSQPSVAPGQTGTFTLSLTAPSVGAPQTFTEFFALSESTNGYFGPPDNAASVLVAVQPPDDEVPLPFIVQGLGPNSIWYFETSAGWDNSTVGFTTPLADPPTVTNGGSQRFAGVTTAATLNRGAEFRPIFPRAGRYRVEVAWPASTNNINQVTYIVTHRDGSQTFTRNQKTGANSWSTLGTFSFTAATTTTGSITHGVHNIRVTNANIDGTVGAGNRFYSGAARFTFVEPDPVADVGDWMLYQQSTE